MKSHRSHLSILLALPVLAACAGDAAAPEGRTVQIAVAPLVLPDVEEVCYGLTVYNGNPATPGTETVWSNADVCSVQYGNSGGGDVSYVGPCDADTPSPTDNDNYVKLVLNSIEVPSGQGSYPAVGLNFLDDQATALLASAPYTNDGDADFQNPCLGDAGCVLKFECKENQDVLVEFNLTVMVDANQGFFDIAVNFEDIFCSAKYDTCYAFDDDETAEVDETEWIELLFGDDSSSTTPVDGPGRDKTGVLALACSGGPDTAAVGARAGVDYETTLHYGQVTLSCTDGLNNLPIAIQLALAAGTHETAIVDWQLDSDPSNDTSIQYSTFFGSEQLDCGAGLSCNKRYLNIAIDLEDIPSGWDCSLSAQATATNAPSASGSTAPLINGVLAGSGSNYPFVNFAIQDALACQKNALGGAGDVSVLSASNFVGGLSADPMCYRFDGVAVTGEIACTQGFDAATGGTVSVVPQGGALGPIQIVASPGDFVSQDGSPATGGVILQVSTTGIPNSTSVVGGGTTGPAAVAVDISFVDALGNPLQVAPGQIVTIILPLPDGTLNLGDEVYLFRWDEAAAAWVPEAVGTVIASNGGLAVRADVTHFTKYKASATTVTALELDCGCPRPAECESDEFTAGFGCFPCDPSCLTCIGFGPSSCDSCESSKQLVNGACIECDPTCATCSGPGAHQCTSCSASAPFIRHAEGHPAGNFSCRNHLSEGFPIGWDQDPWSRKGSTVQPEVDGKVCSNSGFEALYGARPLYYYSHLDGYTYMRMPASNASQLQGGFKIVFYNALEDPAFGPRWFAVIYHLGGNNFRMSLIDADTGLVMDKGKVADAGGAPQPDGTPVQNDFSFTFDPSKQYWLRLGVFQFQRSPSFQMGREDWIMKLGTINASNRFVEVNGSTRLSWNSREIYYPDGDQGGPGPFVQGTVKRMPYVGVRLWLGAKNTASPGACTDGFYLFEPGSNPFEPQ